MATAQKTANKQKKYKTENGKTNANELMQRKSAYRNATTTCQVAVRGKIKVNGVRQSAHSNNNNNILTYMQICITYVSLCARLWKRPEALCVN